MSVLRLVGTNADEPGRLAQLRICRHRQVQRLIRQRNGKKRRLTRPEARSAEGSSDAQPLDKIVRKIDRQVDAGSSAEDAAPAMWKVAEFERAYSIAYAKLAMLDEDLSAAEIAAAVKRRTPPSAATLFPKPTSRRAS